MTNVAENDRDFHFSGYVVYQDRHRPALSKLARSGNVNQLVELSANKIKVVDVRRVVSVLVLPIATAEDEQGTFAAIFSSTILKQRQTQKIQCCSPRTRLASGG